MPGLHVHLKQGIDYGCLQLVPDDSEKHIADDHYDPAQRAAKRRRVEAIATQYLRGKTPFILSAGLRGPFDKGWRNPWKRKVRKEKVLSGQTGHLKQANQKGASSRNTTEAQFDEDLTSNRTQQQSNLPSPETSRAAVVLSQADPVEEQQHYFETPFADSAVQPEHSGDTEFHSVDADPTIDISASDGNPFWLRRQPSERLYLEQSEIQGHGSSPTRSRTRSRPLDKNGHNRIFPQTRARTSPTQTNTLDHEWPSSASATMDISSAARPSLSAPNGASATSLGTRPHLTGPLHGVTSTDDREAPSASPVEATTAPTVTASARADTPKHLGGQTSQLRVAESNPRSTHNSARPMTRSQRRKTNEHASSFTPINAASRMAGPGSAYTVHFEDAHPSVCEGHRAATNLALQAIEAARKAQSLGQSPGRSVGQSAERSAQPTKRSSSKHRRNLGNNRVTSPTPASSTGLTYRKVEEKSKVGQKSKPRPVTFSSSPAAGAGALQKPEAPPQEPSPMDEGNAIRPDIYDVPRSPEPGDAEQEQSLRTSRNSGYSTQAAMMLAQLEFQEGTMPSAASETPGPWLAPEHHTPQPFVEEPTLAYTPFSEFNADLDKRHVPEEMAEDVPMSTQELLMAASPFAFSTVKRKPVRPQGSHLRFSVYPGGEQTEHGEHLGGTKSPTPSERIPLRARNSQVSLPGTASEKETQDPSLVEPKLTRQSVELPQLDFRTTLDDLGPNGDMEFTDRFLRNLKGMA